MRFLALQERMMKAARANSRPRIGYSQTLLELLKPDVIYKITREDLLCELMGN